MNALKNSFLILTVSGALLTACGGTGPQDSVTVQGDVAIAYVKRPISTLGNPTDSIIFGAGGDLYVRDKSSPSAPEKNVTGSYTLGQGDVSDPEVSYDGTKLIFAMRCGANSAPQCLDPNTQGTSDTSWNIWEYTVASNQLKRIISDNAASSLGDDSDPAYLSNGQIVFVSTRQEKTKQLMVQQGLTPFSYRDEYEREAVTVLHVMDSDGGNVKQISFNQSHDRNPTQLQTGEIMFARWDHVGGRNQFSVFKVNADGTDAFVLYGAHSPGNSYLHPREMPDKRVISSLMPLSGTREGGSLEIIDVVNYSENDDPADPSNPPPNQLGAQSGQFQVSRLMFPSESDSTHSAMRGMQVSPLGRYSTPYPLWDGTNRVLVSYTPSQPTQGTNAMGQAVTVEGTPKYGIFMLDLDNKTLLPVVTQQDGFVLADPVAIQPRPVPKPPTITPTNESQTGVGFGILNVKSVYDTDGRGRMGNAVLAAGESIPMSGGVPDIATMKHPANGAYGSRVARFFRITQAVPTPPGLNREVIGETEFEMQQIVGFGLVEPDGSISARVSADTPVTITVLDKEGRGFTHHTNWIQVRSGETRTCNGCHSPRRGESINGPPISGSHPSAAAVGESMSETRVNNIDNTFLNLGRDLAYQDFWTAQYNTRDGTSIASGAPINISYDDLNPAAHAHTSTIPTPVKGSAGACSGGNWSPTSCAIVINYEEHIQPIWTNHCVSCHSGVTPAAGLDLSGTVTGAFGRFLSYQELMVGDPVIDPTTGLPIINIDPEDGEVEIEREAAAVSPGNSRQSRLIERLSEQTLRSGGVPANTTRVVCGAGGAPCLNGATYQNHAAMLNGAEKRLVAEWSDLGGQYYNDPFDGSGNVRSNSANLNQSTFATTVHPILMASCAGCHQAFGSTGDPNPAFTGNRFVLTGNVDADFSVTAGMVNDVCNPDNSYILYRPSRSLTDTPPHPDAPGQPVGTAVLPLGSADYTTIRTWIVSAGSSCP
jgi:hypothetical protein